MNSLVVLVAFVASLVHASPYWYPGATPWYGPVWRGPQNIPVVLPSGHLADTPEVSALKAAHAVAVANTPGAHGPLALPSWPWYGPYPHHGPAPWHGSFWHGPLANPVVLPSGYLADTPEVAALKAVHATAQAHTAQ